jgi:hypothetical protein
VELTLGVSRPGPLVRAPDLAASDLVVSHDWSGDPLVNLRLIWEYLEAAREIAPPAPPLMMEDLERHPYPIDLSLFAPLARTAAAYGHRTSDAGVGRHGRVELGVPLFSGGVVLGLDDPWWREIGSQTLRDVFNFLVFNQFGNHRQNVLEGGADPLLAPAMLDWWTDYGHRTVDDHDVREDSAAKARMLRSVAEIVPLLDEELRQRMACRMALYRSLLEARVAGVETLSLMPAARLGRRPEPGHFPSPEMERLYREALRQVATYRADVERERAEAWDLLRLIDTAGLAGRVGTCPAVECCPEAGDGAAWSERYRRLSSHLQGAQ